MGHTDQADHYTHFSYEMVALTPRCAVELGYERARGRPRPPLHRGQRPQGLRRQGRRPDRQAHRRGAAAEVDEKQAASPEHVRRRIAKQIAIGALRYFMLKFTRNSVIAFDFKDALSFEGETGPYCQYAVVRIRNIFRKGGTTPEAVLAEFDRLSAGPASAGPASVGPGFSPDNDAAQTGGALAPEGNPLAAFLTGDQNENIWALWLRAGRRSMVLDQAIATSEPAHLAKHAFQLAQEFAGFYHDHHILTEEDPARKTFLLATAAVVLRELTTVLSWLGIESPESM